MVPERRRVQRGVQRESAGVRPQTLRSVHGRGKVFGFRQRKPMMKILINARDLCIHDIVRYTIGVHHEIDHDSCA